MSIKLYGYWRSSATYRVRIALNLKKLDYQVIPVHLVKDGGEQRQDAYKQLNPAMLVPTYVDEEQDVMLNQSLTIIEYIDEKYPQPISLLPQHALDKARVRMICQDIACDIQPVANLRILQKLKTEFEANEQQVSDWAHSSIANGFEALEKRLLTRAGDYAYGYSVTMADVCIVPQVYNALRFKVDMDNYPTLKKVYENCQKLPEFVEASPEKQVDAQ